MKLMANGREIQVQAEAEGKATAHTYAICLSLEKVIILSEHDGYFDSVSEVRIQEEKI